MLKFQLDSLDGVDESVRALYAVGVWNQQRAA